ncbi:radical SAM (seleno)protein TrsS [Desulfovibrio sp. QI0430]
MTLRRTQSLCPVCLRRVEATYERSVKDALTVVLRKTCPDHGTFSVPVWREAKPGAVATPPFTAWSRPKSPSYPANPRTPIRDGCPFDCGLCPAHAQHTCTGLFEVTMRCDMACPVCYASAGSISNQNFEEAGDVPLSVIAAQMDTLKGASGPCNVQISGGEPTMRHDLPQIITLARQRGFGLVQINTNGLRLSREQGYARALREAGLDSVYLQWDGVRESSFTSLRGRECLDFKRRAVRNCAEAGLGVVLVATVVRGVNDGELGDLLRMALELGPAVRGLHMQPAAFFGRYPWSLEEAPRLTLPEVMGALARQAPEMVSPSHLHPPGCENELCSFSAVYRRVQKNGAPSLEWLADAGQSCCSPAPRAAGAEVPPPAEDGARKAKQFVALHWKGDSGGESACACGGASGPDSGNAGNNANADGFSRFLAQAGAEQRFTLSAMAFQDALSLDLDRVRGCCIHVVRPDGRMIPFCLHNLTASDGTRLYGDA